MAESSIEWLQGEHGEIGYTLNVITGCEHAHTGCLGCYAEARGKRYDGDPWGPVWAGGRRIITSPATFNKPLGWALKAALRLGEGGKPVPKEWSDRRSVFLQSLGDILELVTAPKAWPAAWDGERIAQAAEHLRHVHEQMEKRRGETWEMIERTARVGYTGLAPRPRLVSVRCWHPMHDNRCDCGHPLVEGERIPGAGLDYLLLTKRPENWRLVPERVRSLIAFGFSASDQATLDEWGARAMGAPVGYMGFRFRWLSLEPLVGPVVIPDWLLAGLAWVIVGGESDTHRRARPYNLAWAEAVIAQCRRAGVPVFHKQAGDCPVMDESRWRPGPHLLLNAGRKDDAPAGTVPLQLGSKGKNPAWWPKAMPALQARQRPEVLRAAA